MATPISYGIGYSDQNLQAMLNSDTPEIRQEAEAYLEAAQKQQPQKTGILQKIGNFFFPPAAGAEPNFNVITGEPSITTNQFPFRSMAEMAAENELALNNMFSVPSQTNYGNTQSGFATNFPFQQNVRPVNQGIPAIDLSGLPVNMGVANEPDVPQVPLNRGVPFATQAKDFFTKTIPNVIRGGINMLPGIRTIQNLDRFDTLPYQDRQFIKSRMDGGIPGIYVDPNTGLLKDRRGKNVRSLFGNYAESVEKDYEELGNQLEESKKSWENKFGDLNNTNQFGKTWSEMNKNNINNFNFLGAQKAAKDKQTRDLLDKVKEQVELGFTAKIGQSLHGGGDGPSGDKGFGGFKDVGAYDKANQATYDRAVDRHRG